LEAAGLVISEPRTDKCAVSLRLTDLGREGARNDDLPYLIERNFAMSAVVKLGGLRRFMVGALPGHFQLVAVL
jgi:hypothetical protein